MVAMVMVVAMVVVMVIVLGKQPTLQDEHAMCLPTPTILCKFVCRSTGVRTKCALQCSHAPTKP
eukprot:11207207-Alexandrium_andersonii.AAC.1